MGMFKKREYTPVLALNATMDLRTNLEVLNIGAETDRLFTVDLENANLFYTASLVSRNGTIDLSNGVVTTPLPDNTFIDLTHVSGSSFNYYGGSTAPALDYPGFILISSGNNNISEGTLNISEYVSQANYEANPSKYEAPLNIKVSIYPLNQTAYPVSGLGAMSGTSSAPYNTLHDIAIFKAFMTDPQASDFPNFQSYKYTNNYGPYAETDTEAQLPAKVYDGISQYVSSGTYAFKFSAPLPIKQGSVYYFRIELSDPNDNFRAVRIEMEESQSLDPYPNVRFAQEFYFTGGSSPYGAGVNNSIRLLESNTLTSKYTPVTLIRDHASPGYLIYDDAESIGGIQSATVSGLNAGGTTKSTYQSSYLAYTPFTTPSRTTNSAWVGQRIPLSFSGTKTLYGGYHYAQLNWDQSNYNVGTPGQDLFNSNVNPRLGVSGTYPKTVMYEAGLFRVNSESGNVDAHTYVNNSTLLASFSGTINFSDENLNVSDLRYARNMDSNSYPLPNYHMQKVYSIFDNPVTVPSGNYLYAVRYFDELGNSYSDFNYRNTPVGPALINDINFGYNVKAVGGIVENWNNDGKTFINETGLYASGNNFACGLISVPSGNAITLVDDYIVNSQTQKVIIGQSDKLYWTNQYNADQSNWHMFHSGAAINDNALWSAATFNQLWFGHQYAESKGQVWDTTYSGVSYEHGKRPTFTVSGVTGPVAVGVPVLEAGDYKVMIATSLTSGGFRASEIITVSGVTAGQWLHISGLNMQAQYPFDLNTQSTNIFITEPSGNVFYAPVLYDTNSVTPLVLPQPIANNIMNCFVGSGVSISGSNSIPEELNPAYPASYLLGQIDTPPFKKILPFFNFLIGMGNPDFASTFYYSEQLGPQIWGRDGQYTGSYDVDPDSFGQINGAETYRQYLMLMKKNATYRIEYTADTSPFAITQISPNVGCIGFKTTVSTSEGVFWLSQFGPCVTNGSSVEIIGQEILPLYMQLDHRDLEYAVAIHDQLTSTITWSIGNDSENPDKNYGIVFNYDQKSWSIRRGKNWNAAGIVHDPDGFNQIWMGTSMGSLMQDGVGNVDTDLVFNDGNGVTTTSNIQMVVETPWMTFNGVKGSTSDKEKFMRFIQFNIETAMNSSLAIEVYFDYNEAPTYTRTIPIGMGDTHKRASLGGRGKIVKFRMYNIGAPNHIKINNIMFQYQDWTNMVAGG